LSATRPASRSGVETLTQIRDSPPTRVDSRLAGKLEKLGASRLYRCYNCGTCTAICPLSEESAEFPRNLIRYALIGAEEELLSSPGLWMCYYCGECSDNCPKDADPASFVMASRRYAIERYSWGKVASIFYNSSTSMSIGLIAVTFIAIFGLMLVKGSPNLNPPNLQTLVSFQVIHDAGLALGLIVGLSVLANLAIMSRYMHVRVHEKFGLSTRLRTWLSSLIVSVTKQSMAQTDFLKCTNRNRYFAHMGLFWGFVGLSIATAVDFLLGLGKTPLYPFPLQRVLGIVSGVAFIAAGGYYFLKRLRKDERHTRSSHLSDWIFIILILLAGVSGLLLTLSLYANAATLAYTLYVLHLVVVFDLLVMAPFTKFAHAVYRPLALWINETAVSFSKLERVHGGT
jgi:heterodisulfide reductase subunit C2